MDDLLAEINSLQIQLDDSLGALDINSNLSNILFTKIITGNDIVASALDIIGPEPGITSEYSLPPNDNFAKDVGIRTRWIINGVNEYSDDIILITEEEVAALSNQPHSPTNNIFYYVTNRYTNGQAIEFQIPGGGYPTQVMRIIFANFKTPTFKRSYKIRLF